MSLTDILRRLAESNEKAKRRYYEAGTGVRFSAWEEAENRLLHATLDLLPLLLDEIEAGRAVRAHEVAFRDAYTMHEWHMKAKQLALAYDAARARLDEEARKCDDCEANQGRARH